MPNFYEFLAIDPSAPAEQVLADCAAKEQGLSRLLMLLPLANPRHPALRDFLSGTRVIKA